MLIGFCLFVFIFVVTAVSIVCIAGVDLHPNSKMSSTFAYPHVKSNICIQGDLRMKTSSLIKSRTHCLTMCAVVNVDYQVGSHRIPLDRMRIKKHTFLLFKLFSTVKLLFLLKSCHCEIQNHFWCSNLQKRGAFAPEFQMLSKFSLVFINLNCPQILFHRLIGEALLFLWNTIFLMKAMYQEGIFAVEKWQN